MVASVINYLLYPSLSRILTSSELGDVGVVLNIFAQVGSILLALNLVSIYLLSRQEEETARAQIVVIQNNLLRLCFFISAATVILFPILKNVLKIESYGSLTGMLGMLFVVVPAVMWSGYMQGKQLLGVLGIYNIINSLSKTLGAILFALIGLGATGTIFGFGIGFILSLAALKILSPFKLPKIPINPFFKIDTSSIKNIRGLVRRSIITTSLLSVFYSIDIFSAKILLNPADAGIYIGLSTIASAVFFLIMTVAWIIIPNFSKNDIKHNQLLIYKCIAGVFAFTIIACLLFWWKGHSFINLALGETYTTYSSILWKIGLSQGIIGLLSMLALFSIVRERKYGTSMAFIVCITTTASVATGSVGNAGELINRVVMGELIGVLLVGVLAYVEKKEDRCIR